MKWKLLLAAGIIIIVAVMLVFMFTQGSKPSGVEIKDGQLSIGGLFGATVPLSDIDSLQLTEIPPDIVTRTNGSGIGTDYKGEFLLIDDVKARLYIDSSKPPFIVFYVGETVFYINLDTSEQTESLYQQLTDEISK